MTPVLGLIFLATIGYTHHASHDTRNWDPYHKHVAEAVNAIPSTVDGETGYWIAEEVPVPEPALKLLRPNALRNLRFEDYGADVGSRTVSFLVVQCRSIEDMHGHYPPRCYPAQGAKLMVSKPRVWRVPTGDGQELEVSGMEYHFAEPDRRGRPADWEPEDVDEQTYSGRRRIVYNFMILPGRGIEPDMQTLFDHSERFDDRHRGAAQVQVVFGPSRDLPSESERDAIFRDLLGPATDALGVLADGSASLHNVVSTSGRPVSDAQ